MGYSLRLCTLYPYTYRIVVMKSTIQRRLFFPFLPRIQRRRASSDRAWRKISVVGDLKKSCRAKGMPSPTLDDEGVNKYVSSGSSISPV